MQIFNILSFRIFGGKQHTTMMYFKLTVNILALPQITGRDEIVAPPPPPPLIPKKIAARKACLLEITDTEESFVRDLRAVVEEIFTPILKSGLLEGRLEGSS
jgi:hypothetical protein